MALEALALIIAVLWIGKELLTNSFDGNKVKATIVLILIVLCAFILVLIKN